MVLRSSLVAVGQLLRSINHVRPFVAGAEHPRRTQEAKLLKIIRQNQESIYGRKHQFDKINSIEDFQRLVPANEYEDLAPYIEAAMNGHKRQLTVEDPFMFATTSGTTSKPKFIPITETHMQDYIHAFQLHNYHLAKDFPNVATGSYLILTSNDEEGKVASGVPYGAVSGVLNRRQPSIIRQFMTLPYEMCKIKDIDLKYYLMLRIALAKDVTALLACNPSSMILLADQLQEHASDLISDIYSGTVRESYRPPAHLADALAPHITMNKERARQLSALLDKHGTLLPSTVWPNLEMLSCWKGGPMSFYLNQLPEYYGNVAIRDFGYMASEGRGSIPIQNDGAGGVLALTSHFFEFVPELTMEAGQPKFLTADQLELHGRYYIYFTTSSGIYRYNINDVIEVVGFYNRTPIIQFIRKGMGISSITGEKLTEEQVKIALSYAVNQLQLKQIQHFTAAVELDKPPYYTLYAELKSDLPEPVRNEFVRVFDHSLQAQNLEYQDKRQSKRLGTPVLNIVPPGTYLKLRQQRVAEGAPEAQVKIPLLSCSTDFSKSLATLAMAED
ncbi:MAG: GH3 auxin-responsive promoter family protein [Candidatus Obscuribacterales bacterium]|nr:GH3 auxin-responsive promoter family protein [Candidatus Obscuribacterales bacterium]